MAEATKSNHPGVRYRDSKTRKNGIKPDRYFFIRYKLNGKDKEEGVGWASEKVSAATAAGLLAIIKNNIKTGKRPQSLADMRQMENEARQAEELEAQAAHRTHITLAEFWNSDYLPSCVGKHPRTIAFEKSMAGKWIFPIIGSISLQKITTNMVEDVILKATEQGKSPATMAKILGIISQVWNHAASRGLVSGNSPTKRVKLPKKDNRRMRFLTPDEACALLSALRGRSLDMHDMALLSLFCGLRAGEVHALTWSDIDFINGTIYIRDTKNNKNRHAFMGEEVRRMLIGRLPESERKLQYVFPGKDGLVRKWVSDTFERTVRDLGLNNSGELRPLADGTQVPVEISDSRQRVVFHSLRHTFASWLVQKGTPLYTVAKLMGHSTLEMTERYSHLAPDTLQRAALSLEGVLPQSE